MQQHDDVLSDHTHRADILIVGAGMAGLTAATALQATGYSVRVIDKGRTVGGRLASRRIGAATFDHGAQFMTARDSRFAAMIDQWREAGVVEEWYRPSGEGSEGYPRWRGCPTMTAVAQHLARPLHLGVEKRVVALRRDPAGWVAALASGETLLAHAALLTAPVPQSLALLESGGIELPRATRTHLESIDYERCLAVMAVLDGPTRLPPPGGLALTDGPIAWIADHQRKGVSATPAVTLHATAAFSAEHWYRDRQESARTLLRAAAPWLGANVTEFQVHGWRFSKPLRVEAHPCCVLSASPPLVLAGDAFAGPRVEGAVLSGWAAADALKQGMAEAMGKISGDSHHH
jgi:predicted NAD/FAD-dependent oxidoreductase